MCITRIWEAFDDSKAPRYVVLTNISMDFILDALEGKVAGCPDDAMLLFVRTVERLLLACAADREALVYHAIIPALECQLDHPDDVVRSAVAAALTAARDTTRDSTSALKRGQWWPSTRLQQMRLCKKFRELSKAVELTTEGWIAVPTSNSAESTLDGTEPAPAACSSVAAP